MKQLSHCIVDSPLGYFQHNSRGGGGKKRVSALLNGAKSERGVTGIKSLARVKKGECQMVDALLIYINLTFTHFMRIIHV